MPSSSNRPVSPTTHLAHLQTTLADLQSQRDALVHSLLPHLASSSNTPTRATSTIISTPTAPSADTNSPKPIDPSSTTTTTAPPPTPPSPSTTAAVLTFAATVSKRHITHLHDYNEIRDVGQGMLGLIAEQRGVRLVDVMGEFGVAAGD